MLQPCVQTLLTLRTMNGDVLVGPRCFPHDHRVEALKGQMTKALALLSADDVSFLRDGRKLEEHETIGLNEEGEPLESIDLVAVNATPPCESPTCGVGPLPRCPACGRWREGPCMVHQFDAKGDQPSLRVEADREQRQQQQAEVAAADGSSLRRKRLRNVALPAKPGGGLIQPVLEQ